ncbi:MAG: alpha/beta fold hydrolase, partial [Clostridia bacterium]
MKYVLRILLRILLGIFLVFAPHFVAGFYLLNHFLFAIAISVLLSTAWIWIGIAPYSKRVRLSAKTQEIPMRLTILMGGRTLLHYGLFAVYAQLVFYFVGWNFLERLNLPLNLFIIDLVVTLVVTQTFLLNGALRLIFSSRRLGVVRRVIVFFTFWVPLVNIFVLLYACRLVLEEFDHTLNKVVNHNARVDSQVCQTKYPLLLLHGVYQRDLKYINYWGRIPKELTRNGATIYYGNQEGCGTIENNGEDIKAKIFAIRAETGAEKVNIIAHSKGGLDARYVITVLGMADYVASLTLIGVPNRGTQLVDLLFKVPDRPLRFFSRLIDKLYRKIGDRRPDFYTSSYQFTTFNAAKFNETVHDAPGVYYQSYASEMRSLFSDSLLWLSFLILKKKEGNNDGLTSTESAKWGDFRG